MAVDKGDILFIRNFAKLSIRERKIAINKKLKEEGKIAGITIDANLLGGDLQLYSRVFSKPNFYVTSVDWNTLQANIEWVTEPLNLDKAYLSMATLLDSSYDRDSVIRHFYGFYLSMKVHSDYVLKAVEKADNINPIDDNAELTEEY